MAIFRAGKRIGNMDIRVGIPRDKSLVNVEGDPRLTKQEPGYNQLTSIGKFITEINKGEGVARANRFLIRLYPPRPEDAIQVYTQGGGHQGLDSPNALESNEIKNNVALMCTSVKLPSRDIVSTNFSAYGPGRKMPYAYRYSSVMECEFMADKFLRQRAFFENWQNKMFNSHTHNLNYYQSYIGTMDIYQLGQYREAINENYNDNYRIAYGIRLHEVYPETIGEVMYQSLTDDMIPMPIPIRFAFRTWENLTISQVANAEYGQPTQDMPNIIPSKNYGIFGGILSKLPPWMRKEATRAGKGVIEKVIRDIPIGKKTGGKVMPPFSWRNIFG